MFRRWYFKMLSAEMQTVNEDNVVRNLFQQPKEYAEKHLKAISKSKQYVEMSSSVTAKHKIMLGFFPSAVSCYPHSKLTVIYSIIHSYDK